MATGSGRFYETPAPSVAESAHTFGLGGRREKALLADALRQVGGKLGKRRWAVQSLVAAPRGWGRLLEV